MYTSERPNPRYKHIIMAIYILVYLQRWYNYDIIYCRYRVQFYTKNVKNNPEKFFL